MPRLEWFERYSLGLSGDRQFWELFGLVDPAAEFSGGGGAIGGLVGGDLEFEDLLVEESGGEFGQAGDGADACMEQQTAAIESDGGDTGQIGQGNPLLDVVEVEVEFLGQVGLVGSALGGAQQVEGGLDAEGLEVLTVFGAEAGEMGDRPVGGVESGWGRLRHGGVRSFGKGGRGNL